MRGSRRQPARQTDDVLMCLCVLQVMEHLVCGIEDLCGQWSHFYWKDKYGQNGTTAESPLIFSWGSHLFCLPLLRLRFKKFNDRVLTRILVRDHRAESSIVALYKKLELQNALDLLDTPFGDISAAPSVVSLQYVSFIVEKKYVYGSLERSILNGFLCYVYEWRIREMWIWLTVYTALKWYLLLCNDLSSEIHLPPNYQHESISWIHEAESDLAASAGELYSNCRPFWPRRQ